MQYFYDKFEEDTSPYLTESGDVKGSAKVSLLLGIPPAKEFRLNIARFQPGAGHDSHTHEWEHAFYILKGKGKAVVESEDAIVTEGMLVYIPANLVHSLENAGDEELVVFGVSGPPKTEAGMSQLKRS
jgi:quercetin dioxygenase-like cupin family protein